MTSCPTVGTRPRTRNVQRFGASFNVSVIWMFPTTFAAGGGGGGAICPPPMVVKPEGRWLFEGGVGEGLGRPLPADGERPAGAAGAGAQDAGPGRRDRGCIAAQRHGRISLSHRRSATPRRAHP